MSHITVQEFNRLVEAESPFGTWLGLRLEDVSPERALVRLPYRADFLRPGNAVNGPVLMAVADYAMYALAMSLWADGEAAVSANINVSFLRRTVGRDLVGEARLLRAGRRLAFIEATVSAEGEAAAVAHVTGTYAVPSRA